ncbi:MAG: carboxypeptidase-like regulatory domain-containing protein [Bacteroidales bacterium]|nr:carboxypeptidase-like regulatory domain-containing protein [Bacteroidales bacterium]
MKWISLLIFLFPAFVFAQEHYTVSGRITEEGTGEDLIGATVILEPTLHGTVSNHYGFYSLSAPGGTYSISFSFMGYGTIEQDIVLDRDLRLDIELSEASIMLNEITVSAFRSDRNISLAEMSIERLDVKQLDLIPVLLGEKDILKSLQLLPGIATAMEGSTGFNVRGGSIDQNLILLDEASVYSASHLAGFFSVFNSDIIKDITVYKGGVPPVYGGRASSVVDIRMNNGNNKEFRGKGGIGLLSTRFSIEGPLIRERMSYIISGRRSYADILLKALPGDILEQGTKLFFYDFNAKLNLTAGARDRFFLSAYIGRDVFGYEEAGMDWGNYTGTFRWNHLYNDRVFSNISLIFSDFSYGFNLRKDLKYDSGIRDYGLKNDISFYLKPGHTINTGIELHYRDFNPGSLISSESIESDIILEKKQAVEGAAYVQGKHDILNVLNASYGLRLSSFLALERGSNTGNYLIAEPRLAMNYRISRSSSAKVSYNRLSQYLHLLSNSTAGQVTDLWIPSSSRIEPVIADQLAAGYFRNFFNDMLELSLELYYKNLLNITDFEDGTSLMLNEDIEDQIISGRGRSYGAELLIRKNRGRFRGWISYTLARTENRIDGINNNQWYPARYDKTHDIALVGSYDLSGRIAISSVFVYATGNAVTFPSGKYELNGKTIPYYTERNGYRMPAYHRLDISMKIRGKEGKRFSTSWDISAYNVYNRHNAYSIYFRESENGSSATEAVKLSLFGIVPSVSFNISF